MDRGTWDDWGPWLGERLGEFSAGIHFLTRLPLPRHAPPGGTPSGKAVWAFPLAGVRRRADRRAGLCAGAPAWTAVLAGRGAAVAATLVVTGCLHEDGLADTADGFGGGETRERSSTSCATAASAPTACARCAFASCFAPSALASLARARGSSRRR